MRWWKLSLEEDQRFCQMYTLENEWEGKTNSNQEIDKNTSKSDFSRKWNFKKNVDMCQLSVKFAPCLQALHSFSPFSAGCSCHVLSGVAGSYIGGCASSLPHSAHHPPHSVSFQLPASFRANPEWSHRDLGKTSPSFVGNQWCRPPSLPNPWL